METSICWECNKRGGMGSRPCKLSDCPDFVAFNDENEAIFCNHNCKEEFIFPNCENCPEKVKK